MGLFDFFKKKIEARDESSPPIEASKESTASTFEFLITGEIDIPPADYDQIMTPSSFEWVKVIKDDWPYYQVGNDEFSYSWEMPGIQMTFNEGITFEKAKKIADEVVDNIRKSGQQAELVVIGNTQIFGFE